jgi:molybdate transport system regulatory protein
MESRASPWFGRSRTKTKPITYVPNDRFKRTFTIYAAESKLASQCNLLPFPQFKHTEGMLMKISARNQIKGTVKEVREGAVNAVVVICRGNHNPIKADITMESVKQLGLAEGKECYAVIKSTNVMFATAKIPNISARNQIEGTIVSVKEGAVNGHVTIEDEEGVRVSGSITNESIQQLRLKEGGTAVAIIKATDVMVAVD